jgi:hypothetical protein
MKLFLVVRPSMRGTSIPVYYYTFAENKDDAIKKVSYKWGEYDDKAIARELTNDEIENLVIATNNYG